jgi:Fe(3+) dicitrate transport protein
MKKILIVLIIQFILTVTVVAQNNTVTFSGVVMNTDSTLVNDAEVFFQGTSYFTFTDHKGKFHLYQVVPATYVLIVNTKSSMTFTDTLRIEKDMFKTIVIDTIEHESQTVVIEGKLDETNGISRLEDVDGTSIYAGRKTEVVELKDMVANTAANNPRQIYARIAGVNIFENDGGGIQLGIGGRGLNPNRVSNFNTRQNGYDISADALGYPESYYTPPTEALSRIEIVRGASSLQYGTQFGGFINFKFKEGPSDKKIEVTTRQTLGSFGFFNSFNSIGGTVGKLNYYAFLQYKKAEGWRPNSNYDLYAGHISLKLAATKRLKITGEYTYQYYLAKQAGGLTDVQFNSNPNQSSRNRNWFQVNWNLIAFILDYQFNSNTHFNFRTFTLLAGRDALGYMGNINRPDPMVNRDFLTDQYHNIGAEARLLHLYQIKKVQSTFLIGARYYHGQTKRREGDGTNGSDANFTFVNPDSLEGSNYTFPSRNVALFSENIFYLSSRFSVTPGIRFEYISTNSEGYYANIQKNLAGDVILYEQINEKRTNNRHFVLLGIGMSYQITPKIKWYGNISQNYRSINFNDMRINNPNVQVDPNLKDERGYSVDFGTRGTVSNFLDFDISLFFIQYRDRIGSVLQRNAQNLVYRYRTNISDSRNVGIESFVEIDLLKLFNKEAKNKFTWFNNIAVIDARYISSEQTAYQNNQVEYVPRFNYRTGFTYKYKDFRTTIQWAYLSQQYSDATNTSTVVPNAVIGIIPSYQVMDWSAEYTYKWFTLIGGLNNLLNATYFTRRAEGYPGPGILPSDPRNFFVTLQAKF